MGIYLQLVGKLIFLIIIINSALSAEPTLNASINSDGSYQVAVQSTPPADTNSKTGTTTPLERYAINQLNNQGPSEFEKAQDASKKEFQDNLKELEESMNKPSTPIERSTFDPKEEIIESNEKPKGNSTFYQFKMNKNKKINNNGSTFQSPDFD